MPHSVEGEPDQGPPEELPASVVHHLPEEENQLERVEFSAEKVLDFIRQVQERPSYYAKLFELDLEKTGLLSDLEEAGVLLPSEPPIAAESSTGSGQGVPAAEVRESILKNIYIGAVLGHLFDELFTPK